MATPGVYLLHFDPPYRHAQHYTGWASDIPARVHTHIKGGPRSSPLVRAAVAAGSTVRVTRLWLDADRSKERRLKTSGGASRYCPTCKARARARSPQP